MAVFLFYDPADPSGLPLWDAHLPDDTQLPLTVPAGVACIQVPDPLPGGLTDYDVYQLKVDTSATPSVVIQR